MQTHQGVVADHAVSASWPRLVADALLLLSSVALLVITAHTRFYPLDSPVPVTFQTAAVLLCGFCMRPRLAMLAVVVYLAMGFAFTLGGANFSFFAAYEAGKTTATLGYLVGFIPAAGLVSAMSRSFSRLTLGRTLAMGLFGLVTVFVFGVAWLALMRGSLTEAIQLGLMPFVGWAGLKIALVGSLVRIFRPRPTG